MAFFRTKCTVGLLTLFIASTHAFPFQSFQVLPRYPNTTTTEPYSTVVIETISGTTVTATFGETVLPTPYTSTATLSDGTTSTTVIPIGSPIWTNLGGLPPPGVPTPTPPPIPPPIIPPGGGAGGGGGDDPASTGTSSSSSSETGPVTTLTPHHTIEIPDPGSNPAASSTSEPPPSSTPETPTPTATPPPPPPAPSGRCGFDNIPLYGWHFYVYGISGWGGIDGGDLHREEDGCGALTSWNWEQQPDGTYQASFNLPYFIKSGCVERAIASAGGPSGLSCDDG